MSSENPTTVVLHIDPCCPWAWLTSRWLAEVERVRPVHVVTRLIDLAEANRGKEEGRIRDSHEAGERASRVLVQARREGGDAALARLYTEMGEAYQERAEPLGDPTVLRACARAAGLDPGLVDRALDDPGTLEELLAEHRAATEKGAFGAPTLIVDGAAPIFGPVVDERIGGEPAGELWDHTIWMVRHGAFFELKRERTQKAKVGRYAAAASAS
ncbi:MAG: DsbA family protein [Chloroflexi bacterium]|nr:MAG: DsbA family protein [Chloroflexota bacterium]